MRTRLLRSKQATVVSLATVSEVAGKSTKRSSRRNRCASYVYLDICGRPDVCLQLQRMFDHHRKSPWFAEKYDPAPEFQAMRTRVRKSGWKGRMDAFILDLESGKFDPDLSEPVPEPTKENANGDSAATNGAGTETNTAAEETKPPAAGDDDMQFNVEAEDDAGGDEANRNASDKNKRGANRGEELAVPPEGNQVMIRTIPPDIGRAKLEEVSVTIARILP